VIAGALRSNSYTFTRQERVGKSLFGGHYIADLVVEWRGMKYVISCKWQQVPGTTEQKVLYEIASLIKVVKEGGFGLAFLVIGGPGWSRQFREALLENLHVNVLKDGELVKVVDLDHMVAIINRGSLTP